MPAMEMTMRITSFFTRALDALADHFEGVRRYETNRLVGARRDMWKSLPKAARRDADC